MTDPPDRTAPRTIFLTGATGHIGSALLAELLAAGHAVFALTRHPARLDARKHPRLRVVGGDITHPRFGLDAPEYAGMAAACDAVLHAAARTAFDDTDGSLYAANVHGTREVLEFAKRTARKRMDYFSTAYVRAAESGLAFRNEYERTKYEAERTVRQAFEQGHVVGKILRPSIVVDPSAVRASSPKDGLHRLLTLLVRLKAAHREIPGSTRLSADPNGRTNFVVLDHVVQAALQLCMTTRGDGAVYSLIDPNPRTNAEMLRMISEAAGVEGVRLADLRATPPHELTPWERRLTDLLVVYAGYLFDHGALEAPEFDGVIDRHRLPPAGLTPQDLHRMVDNLRGNHGIHSTRSDNRNTAPTRS